MIKIALLLAFFSITSWSNSSVLRGEKYFYQYCSGCHSLKYGKQQSVYWSNMRPEDAKKWFGQIPPDLSLVTLQYSKKWLQAYLNGFYPDSHGRFGVNNQVVPHVVMPNVLASGQDLGSENKNAKIAEDISHYLAWVAEPEYASRVFWGKVVMIFCLIAIFMLLSLKKMYKK